jgi:ABC-2 type transport system ATP-binding protein
MTEALPVVEASGLRKQFSTALAVDNLDFQIAPGEILALLGPNGAGKTTTVRMLVGILRPDSGSIAYRLADGRAATARGQRGGAARGRPDTANRDRPGDTACGLPGAATRGRPGASICDRPDPSLLAYLPEDRGLVRDVPVLRTLEFFATLRGLDRATARRRAREELERFELGDRAGERLDRLSKGNQQKVQFLAAILHRPRLAVLDEPFSGFDPINQQRFVEEIRRLRGEGCTVLLSAHQMDLVEQLADRLILMDRGQAVLAGTMAEIRGQTTSGQRIELELTEEISLDSLREPAAEMTPAAFRNRSDRILPAALLDIPGVERADLVGPRRIALGLAPGAGVGEVLHRVTGLVVVQSVHSAPERLHEIFLRSVGRDISPEELAPDGGAKDGEAP